MPLADVQRADIAVQLRQIAQGPQGKSARPQAALRARRTLSTVFSWCIGEGLCETNPVSLTNVPAQEIRRERVLTDAELMAVWRACPPTDDFGRIIRLLILTGQRRDEVAGLRWEEIDLGARALAPPCGPDEEQASPRGPVERTGRCHPRRGAAHRSREALPFGSGAGPFSGFSKAKRKLDARVAITESRGESTIYDALRPREWPVWGPRLRLSRRR